MKNIKVKIFGKLTDIFKAEEYSVDEVSTVSELQDRLEQTFPNLKTHTYLLVVNNEVVKKDESIPSGAEVALLPPYSGG